MKCPVRLRRLPGAAQLLGGQQRIHGAGAEAFQIEGDEFKAECLEDRGELGRDGWMQGALEFIACNLNADDFPMMANAELAEAEGSNRILAALDHIKRLARHRAAVFHAGREARGSGLVPDAEPGLMREFANLLLGEPRC